MMDIKGMIISAITTTGIGGTLAGMAFAARKVGDWHTDHVKLKADFIAHKDYVANAVTGVKLELASHETRDNDRHKEVIERIAESEKNIIQIIREK